MKRPCYIHLAETPKTSLVGFEYHFLYFHGVEDFIGLDSLRKGHYFVRHETISINQQMDTTI